MFCATSRCSTREPGPSRAWARWLATLCLATLCLATLWACPASRGPDAPSSRDAELLAVGALAHLPADTAMVLVARRARVWPGSRWPAGAEVWREALADRMAPDSPMGVALWDPRAGVAVWFTRLDEDGRDGALEAVRGWARGRGLDLVESWSEHGRILSAEAIGTGVVFRGPWVFVVTSEVASRRAAMEVHLAGAPAARGLLGDERFSTMAARVQAQGNDRDDERGDDAGSGPLDLALYADAERLAALLERYHGMPALGTELVASLGRFVAGARVRGADIDIEFSAALGRASVLRALAPRTTGEPRPAGGQANLDDGLLAAWQAERPPSWSASVRVDPETASRLVALVGALAFEVDVDRLLGERLGERSLASRLSGQVAMLAGPEPSSVHLVLGFEAEHGAAALLADLGVGTSAPDGPVSLSSAPWVIDLIPRPRHLTVSVHRTDETPHGEPRPERARAIRSDMVSALRGRHSGAFSLSGMSLARIATPAPASASWPTLAPLAKDENPDVPMSEAYLALVDEYRGLVRALDARREQLQRAERDERARLAEALGGMRGSMTRTGQDMRGRALLQMGVSEVAALIALHASLGEHRAARERAFMAHFEVAEKRAREIREERLRVRARDVQEWDLRGAR